MTPENKARKQIDKLFEEAGWQVVSRDDYAPNISAVAIEEGLLKHNKRADYFLFLNGKAVGVLEAKREDLKEDLSCACDQAELYAKGVPLKYQAYQRPLPIIYLSNGKQVLFKDFRYPDSKLIELNRIHTPKEIVKLLGIKDEYAALPMLTEREKKALRACQYEAITKLEKHPMKPQYTKTIKELLNIMGRNCSFGLKLVFANMWLFKGLVKKLFTMLSADTRALLTSTFAFTIINGGNQTNIIPNHVEANINVRIAPFDTVEDVLNHVKKVTTSSVLIKTGKELKLSHTAITALKTAFFNYFN